MRRGEANHSHHPKKVNVLLTRTISITIANCTNFAFQVAINSLATDSNKQANTSSVSGSTLNNNKISFNNQQQQQQSAPSSESKESNFEYDDNEWDVGGIGDLIIDLDNDIEQSSGSTIQHIASDISSSQSSVASLSSSSTSSSSVNPQQQQIGSIGTSNQTNAHPAKPITKSSPSTSSSSQSSTSSSASATNVLHSTTSTTTGTTTASTTISSTSLVATEPKKSFPFASVVPKQQILSSTTSASVISAKQQQSTSKSVLPTAIPVAISAAAPTSALIAQLNSHRQVGFVDTLLQKTATDPLQINMSSQPGGQGAGKAGTKISIDHQSLKMKIKRTKPGTKTSEAKHEIVKADMQNGGSGGAISGADDSSSSTGSSGKNQRTGSNAQQPAAGAAVVSAAGTTAATASSTVSASATSVSQATKRGSSGHRRDKTKEKTLHSQRDKSDQQQHNSLSGATAAVSASQNNDRTSSSSSSSSSTSTSSLSCNCSHENQVNGNQPPCSNGSCVRNRTMDPASMPLSQRIAAANQINNSKYAFIALILVRTGFLKDCFRFSCFSSTSNSNSTPMSSGAIPTGIFAASSITGNLSVTSSGLGAPNAPGPPKDSKVKFTYDISFL